MSCRTDHPSGPATQLGRMSREPRLGRKVALITGAARGIGQAIAVRFVEEGARVVLCDKADCSETVRVISRIEGAHDVAMAIQCDISDEESISNLVSQVESRLDHVDILVNNAATFVFQSIETATAADWDASCGVNIRGTALLTKHMLPLLKKSERGASIVFIGSISSCLAQPNCVTYSVTKAGLVQMAKNSAYDLAKYGIRVNAVCPGTIETPTSRAERDAHGWSYEEWERRKVADVMMGRVGRVGEVANAVLFYAGEESSYCTGGCLFVDGGQSSCTVMN